MEITVMGGVIVFLAVLYCLIGFQYQKSMFTAWRNDPEPPTDVSDGVMKTVLTTAAIFWLPVMVVITLYEITHWLFKTVRGV